MDEQISKFNGSDIIEWAKDLKHNERTAKKYEGVQTVKDILKVAREDGYNFTEKELLDFNLDLVAGGVGDIDVNVKSKVDTSNKQDTTTHTTKVNKTDTNMAATIQGSNNSLPWQNSNNANQ